MTKQNEIDALDAFIASLPADSYLRPALEDARSCIVADIMDDFPVALLSVILTRKAEVAAASKDLADLRKESAAVESRMREMQTHIASYRDSLNKIASHAESALRLALNFRNGIDAIDF